MDYAAITWTRPVPWAGFTNLPADPQKAAETSLTIRYQREVIRRHVAACKGRVVKELALIELAPDRASVEAMAPLRQLVAQHGDGLRYVFVDFSVIAGWRRHGPLLDALGAVAYDALPPDEIMLDGKLFDPIAHFRCWSQRDEAHRVEATGLPPRVRAIVERINGSLRERADALNAAGLRTPTGKLWTPDNLRKFLKKWP